MYVGVDLGGTNIAAAIVDEECRIIRRFVVPTTAQRGAETVISKLISSCQLLTELLIESGIKPISIGIGVPGLINSKTGEVLFTPNLPLSGVNIASELQKEIDCPVHIANDANCAALGEVIAGGARGAKDAVIITLGTGVGGGIILGGRLYAGKSGAAGELGHMVITAGGRECGCGRRGCWETYASASGLIKTAKGHMGTYADSKLWELCDGETAKIDGQIIFDAYRAGDQAARFAVKEYIVHLATGLINLINIFSPEIICIGGGISNAWDCISEPLQALVDAESITRSSPISQQTRIVKAELGNDAGIIGAAMLGKG